jgi:predicted nucleotide-binding protein
MTCDELRTVLVERGVGFAERPTQGGTSFKCTTGEIFNAFDTGNMSFQGKTSTTLSAEIKTLHEGAGSAEATVKAAAVAAKPPKVPVAPVPVPAPVFIVYGHDLTARNHLELILRRMGLNPIIIGNLPAAGDTVIEKLEHYLGEHGNVGFACVLLTPDDEGHKATITEEKRYRARQNVVLELGMVLARIGRKRVAILHKQSVELPSDIAGLIYIAFEESLDEAKPRLFNELRQAGYEPDPNALN